MFTLDTTVSVHLNIIQDRELILTFDNVEEECIGGNMRNINLYTKW